MKTNNLNGNYAWDEKMNKSIFWILLKDLFKLFFNRNIVIIAAFILLKRNSKYFRLFNRDLLVIVIIHFIMNIILIILLKIGLVRLSSKCF